MAQRTSGGAYDFARFERAQAAPQRVPARPQKTPRRLTKVPEPRKDALQRQRENIDFLRRTDRKSTRLNSSHTDISRMPSSA